MRFRFVLQLDGLFDDDPDGFDSREICTGELTIDASAKAEPRLVELFGEIHQLYANRLAALRPDRHGGDGASLTSPSPL